MTAKIEEAIIGSFFILLVTKALHRWKQAYTAAETTRGTTIVSYNSSTLSIVHIFQRPYNLEHTHLSPLYLVSPVSLQLLFHLNSCFC